MREMGHRVSKLWYPDSETDDSKEYVEDLLSYKTVRKQNFCIDGRRFLVLCQTAFSYEQILV